MTRTEFYEKRNRLIDRMNVAIKIRASFTTKARMREIAKLWYEYDGTPEAQTIAWLQKKYVKQKLSRYC